MAAIQVNEVIFQKLKQAYSEKFGSSPTSLVNKLNHVFKEEFDDKNEKLIAERTIRNFFNSPAVPKMQEKNLNYLCTVLLEKKSYTEAVNEIKNNHPDIEEYSLDSYWKHLERKCKMMKVLDMNEPRPIDSIYVRFSLIKNPHASRQQTIQSLLNYPDNELHENVYKRLRFSGNESYEPALDAAIKYQKLIILGKPGAGKTTFLKYLAMHFIAEESNDKVIPIFIALRDISDNGGHFSLLDEIIKEFTNCMPNSEKNVSKLLERGQCLILLDGLDEIKVDNNSIYSQIDEFTEKFPDNRFIITCRNAACDYVFNDFTEVEVADFEPEEIKTFVRNWFQSRGEDNICDRFLKKLEENQQVKELATNPLLLTILCLTFEDNYDFSSNRYALYADAVDTLLRRWDASRRVERRQHFNISRQRKINMFSEIAYKGLSNEPAKFLWTQWELKDQIDHFLQKIVSEEIDTQEILKRIEANHGLLIQQAKGIYSFAHLTFQEYFAAEYIVENRQPEFLKSFVKQNLLERHWREVFILITERLSDADEFLKLIFSYTNDIVKNSPGLQSMLRWLHKMTSNAGISSSGWRAYYLAIDLDVELYISQDIQIERSLFGKLATELRNYNKKRNKLTPPQPKALLISRLVGIHALAIDQANIDNKLSEKTEFTRKVFQLKNINEQLSFAIDKAQEANINDLANKLIILQSRHPGSNASSFEWKIWAVELQKLMVNYLEVGYSIDLAPEDVKALEDYIYANYLLLECICGENNSSRSLRDAIIDNLLLPQDEIPTPLLNV
ncbi:NACHT domain-containing protein [Nostoc sp. FACHB-152]|uniref:NACHT domain-containing protein n=1 Tax=unclassified Nostoc TaxID=2593658 RepID=UPI001687217C|nr:MULTISPECIES: NACHT domain-containing protein [unclassified Nostoc]MBD2449707.1 NACHT domain-containing protein [Nostoc sp. FACHB-152]MBD2469073.1 NACHT domain-containing protein [Nostoc sp. FACHB-145]